MLCAEPSCFFLEVQIDCLADANKMIEMFRILDAGLLAMKYCFVLVAAAVSHLDVGIHAHDS